MKRLAPGQPPSGLERLLLRNVILTTCKSMVYYQDLWSWLLSTKGVIYSLKVTVLRTEGTMAERMGGTDLGTLWYLDTPTYTIAEASRIVGLTSNRVRRWLEGYSFHYTTKFGRRNHISHKDPVVERGEPRGTTYASFLELIDLLYIKQFLDEGFSLQKMRLVLEEARDRLGTYHFARLTFFTDGRNIHLQLGQDGGPMMALLTGGQYSIAEIIVELGKRIDFHEATGWAERWYPRGREGLVVIDPRISFGRPTIIGRGISTSNIYDLYKGEGEKVPPVCRWFDLDESEARAAVDYEQLLAA